MVRCGCFYESKTQCSEPDWNFCAGIMILARTFYLKKHTSIWNNSQIENIC